MRFRHAHVGNALTMVSQGEQTPSPTGADWWRTMCSCPTGETAWRSMQRRWTSRPARGARRPDSSPPHQDDGVGVGGTVPRRRCHPGRAGRRRRNPVDLRHGGSGACGHKPLVGDAYRSRSRRTVRRRHGLHLPSQLSRMAGRTRLGLAVVDRDVPRFPRATGASGRLHDAAHVVPQGARRRDGRPGHRCRTWSSRASPRTTRKPVRICWS